jgi:phosphopantetheinyl transferase (holo-ACP synthase)
METPFNYTELSDFASAGNDFAIGNDVVYVPNFEQSFNALFQIPILRYASTWAAKEAVYKAIKQIDSTLLGWKSIEIIRDKVGGKPQLVLHKHSSKFTASISISHDGDYVWALALLKRTAKI